jgi:hypothetical protein
MAIQSSMFSGTALTSRTFQVTKHIGDKSKCAVYLQRVSDDVWVLQNQDIYQLINNSIVFDTEISSSIYSQMEIRVADTPDELEDNPSDIAIVAGIANDITTVAGVSGDVEIVADNIGSVVATADSIASVDTVASNITDVNIVSAAIQGGGSTPTDGGQFYGDGLVRGIQYMAKSIGNSNIVITSDVNAFSIDNIAVGSGGSITVEDGAIFKVL